MRHLLAFFGVCIGAARADVTLIPAQSIHKDEVFQRELERQRALLREELALHPDFGVQPTIPTTFYRNASDLGYRTSILVNPCAGKAWDCCIAQYGQPEYKDAEFSTTTRTASGAEMDPTRSRWPVDQRFIDPTCVEEDGKLFKETRAVQPDGSVRTTRVEVDAANGNSPCLEHQYGRARTATFPDCWDANSTITSTDSCFSNNGTRLPHCVALAYTQNAYIVACGGDFADSDICGTFLELHFPGDERVLSSTRLDGGLITGYRAAHLPLTHLGVANHIVCRGQYEIWWVQRTRSSWVVQERKRFFVERPECSFDIVAQEYREYVIL